MTETEQLKSLLAEVINELCCQAMGSDQDTLDYIDSLIEQAKALGVEV